MRRQRVEREERKGGREGKRSWEERKLGKRQARKGKREQLGRKKGIRKEGFRRERN